MVCQCQEFTGGESDTRGAVRLGSPFLSSQHFVLLQCKATAVAVGGTERLTWIMTPELAFEEARSARMGLHDGMTLCQVSSHTINRLLPSTAFEFSQSLYNQVIG